MAEHIKALRKKNGSIYDAPIPLGADALYVDLKTKNKNGDNIERNLQDVVGEYKKNNSIADIIEKHFYGTMKQWNALSVDEKIDYDMVDILEEYTIHYDSNGGTGSMSDDIKVTGEVYTIKPNSFTAPESIIDTEYIVESGYRYKKKYDFVFDKWNTTIDGDGVDKTPGDLYRKDANLNLYAQWKKVEDIEHKQNEQYYVTVITDEGATAIPSGWFDKGSNVDLQVQYEPGYVKASGVEIIQNLNAPTTVNITTIPVLEFSSDEPFTLSTYALEWDGTLEYSLDNGDTWTTWNGSELSGTSTQSVYIRGINNTIITKGTGPWIFTGKYCIGNIETLLDYQTVASGQHPIMGNLCYGSMFSMSYSLITAPSLPAITLTDYCYAAMFQGCTSLATVPELPATTLALGCYSNMFLGCTSLTTAPSLPATILVDYCYFRMFYNCTSLTTVPQLPAITLAGYCYAAMFQGCTSLATVPELPAITLADYCYSHMFQGCTSFKLSTTQTPEYQYPYRIPTSDTGTTATNALNEMFNGTGGTFTGTPTINTTYYTDHEPI